MLIIGGTHRDITYRRSIWRTWDTLKEKKISNRENASKWCTLFSSACSEKEVKCQLQGADCRDQGESTCFPPGGRRACKGSLAPVQMVTGPGEGTPGNQWACDKCLLRNRCIAKCHKVGSSTKKSFGDIYALEMPALYYNFRFYSLARG